MYNKIINVIEKMANVEKIEKTDSLQELGFDSLKMVELLFELESELEMELDEGKIMRSKMETVQDIMDFMISEG